MTTGITYDTENMTFKRCTQSTCTLPLLTDAAPSIIPVPSICDTAVVRTNNALLLLLLLLLLCTTYSILDTHNTQ
jgi:hypothetical protein